MVSTLLNLNTQDPGELLQAIRRMGITCSVRTTDPAFPLDYSLDALVMDDFIIGRARSGGGVEFIDIDGPDLLGCYIPLSGPAVLGLREGVVAPGPDQLVLVHTGGLRHLTFSLRHRMLFFALPVASIEAHLRGRCEGTGRLFFDHLVLDQSDSVGAAMLHFSWLMLDLLSGQSIVDMSPIKLRRCRDGFLDLVAAALFRDKNRHFFESSVGASLAQVRRAEEYMRENCRKPIGVTDVAAHLGVSVRAMQLAFRKQRDATPLQVLQRFRLEGLRKELEAGPGESMAAIAAAWGFSSAGRLSGRYRALFGETPLQTWRRARLRPRVNAA